MFRSLFAAALAALIATPALAAPPAKKASTQAAPARTSTAAAATTASGGLTGLTIGASIGYESGDIDGLALRVDGELPIKPLTPKVALSGVVSVGYSRFSQEVAYTDLTFNIFKLIPAARFTMPVAPQISLYGDAGLGLYNARFTAKTTTPALPGVPSTTTEVSDSSTNFLMRFGVGGMYQLNPKLKLTGEIGLMPYFGDNVDTTNWTFALGAMFAM